MSAVLPCLSSPASPVSTLGSLGDPLLDAYLEFVSARSRPNTVLATWFDLKVFFAVVGKPVAAVRPVDVLGFISAQRAGLPSWAGGWIPDRLIFMFQAALLVSYQSRSASFGVRYWSAECSRF